MLTLYGEIAALVLAVLLGISVGWAVWGRGSGSRRTGRPRHAAPRRSALPTAYDIDLSTGDVRVLPRNSRDGKRREPAHANARRTDRPDSTPTPTESTDAADTFEPAAPADAAAEEEGADSAAPVSQEAPAVDGAAPSDAGTGANGTADRAAPGADPGANPGAVSQAVAGTSAVPVGATTRAGATGATPSAVDATRADASDSARSEGVAEPESAVDVAARAGSGDPAGMSGAAPSDIDAVDEAAERRAVSESDAVSVDARADAGAAQTAGPKVAPPSSDDVSTSGTGGSAAPAGSVAVVGTSSPAPSDIDGAGGAATERAAAAPAASAKVAPPTTADPAVPAAVGKPVSGFDDAVPSDVEAGPNDVSESDADGAGAQERADGSAGGGSAALSDVDGAGEAAPGRASAVGAVAGPAGADRAAAADPVHPTGRAAAVSHDLPAADGIAEQAAVLDLAEPGVDGTPADLAHPAGTSATPAPSGVESDTDAPGVGGNGPRSAAVASGNGAVPPAAVGSPVEGGDDLRQVVGIGPVIQQVLAAVGVTTYRHLVELADDGEALARAATALGGDVRARIERQRWVEQARELHFRKYGERL